MTKKYDTSNRPYSVNYYKYNRTYPYQTAQETQNAYIKIYSALQDIEREKWCDIVVGLKPEKLDTGKKISLNNVCNHFIKKYKDNPNLASIYEYLT